MHEGPPPPRLRRVLIGTSGYVYADWRGRFYPRDLPAREWLRYYAGRFPTVELNSPFYRLPTTATFRAWAGAVPPPFLFAVKASRFLTHIKRLRDPGPPLTLFMRRAKGLGDKRGPILFQLPARFHLSLERLDAFLRALAARRIRGAVLEVRHASWLIDPVFERLARANVALCFHDWREQPVTGPVTADFVYVRRHGTRRGYGGSYGDRMLQQDTDRIVEWRTAGKDVYVYFNNDGRAAAVRNALRLTDLVSDALGRRRAA
jgi:uncharacterized protein YecE (DUF72 family)